MIYGKYYRQAVGWGGKKSEEFLDSRECCGQWQPSRPTIRDYDFDHFLHYEIYLELLVPL